MIELRECPFCGSKRINVYEGLWTYTAVCIDCKASGGPASDADEAAKLWNDRKGYKLELASLYGKSVKE